MTCFRCSSYWHSLVRLVCSVWVSGRLGSGSWGTNRCKRISGQLEGRCKVWWLSDVDWFCQSVAHQSSPQWLAFGCCFSEIFVPYVDSLGKKTTPSDSCVEHAVLAASFEMVSTWSYEIHSLFYAPGCNFKTRYMTISVSISLLCLHMAICEYIYCISSHIGQACI